MADQTLNINRQRFAIKEISPPWLSSGFGEKFLYNFGLGEDALTEKIRQGILARVPTQCDPTALPLIGADKLMTQGPSEQMSSFRTRLKRAWDTFQLSGETRAVLSNVLAYVTNPATAPAVYTPAASIVKVSDAGTYATWDTYYFTDDTTAPPSHKTTTPINWNWDGVNNNWQAYLILYFPITLSSTVTGTAATLATSGTSGHVLVNGLSNIPSVVDGSSFLLMSGAANSANNGLFQVTNLLGSAGVWVANSGAVIPDANSGSITWRWGQFPTVAPQLAWGTPNLKWGAANKAWGVNVSPAYMTALRTVLRTWKSESTFYPWIIFSFTQGNSGTELGVNQSAGGHNPGGTWGHWGTTSNRVYVSARNAGLDTSRLDAFADGSGIYVKNFQLPLCG